MSDCQPMACDLHDYLEIACLYHYRMRIELIDGTIFEATALTTTTDADKEEFLAQRVLMPQGDTCFSGTSAITSKTTSKSSAPHRGHNENCVNAFTIFQNPTITDSPVSRSG